MKMDETKICIGIDLGTTNTSAAYSTLSVDGQISVVDLEIRQKGRGSQRTFDTLPSIMYVKEDGEAVVGREAIALKEQSSIGRILPTKNISRTSRLAIKAS